MDNKIQKDSSKFKLLSRFNKIRTKLLIYSNVENKRYINENKTLFNSISPDIIAKKYDNFKINIENSYTNYKQNYECKAEIKTNIKETNRKDLCQNVLVEKSIDLVDFFDNKKISCSHKKIKRNSELMIEQSLHLENLINEKKSINNANNINNYPSNFNFNSKLSNDYQSFDKKRNQDPKNVKKNFYSNNFNSNSIIFSKTVILNNYSNRDKINICKQIQKGFEYLQKLAYSMKITNNFKIIHKQDIGKFDELFDILEYKGLSIEKNLINENLNHLKLNNKIKLQNALLAAEEENFNVKSSKNKNEKNIFLDYGGNLYQNLNNENKSPFIDKKYKNLKSIASDEKKNYKNPITKNNLEFAKENFYYLKNGEKFKEEYNSFISKIPNDSKNKKNEMAISPKKNKIGKPPLNQKSSKSLKDLDYNKKIEKNDFNFINFINLQTKSNYNDPKELEKNLKNLKVNKKYNVNYDSFDSSKKKILIPSEDFIKEKNQIDNHSDKDQYLIINQSNHVENQDLNNAENEEFEIFLDNKNENNLDFKNQEGKLSCNNNNINHKCQYQIGLKFQKGFDKLKNKNLSKYSKNDLVINNKNKIINLNSIDNQTQNYTNSNNTNITSLNNLNFTNLNINTNNTLSGFITNELKQFENSNINSNSLLTNNFHDFNSNIYMNNNKSNNSPNGYSTVSFYEMNSENGPVSDYNSNFITNSNYISIKYPDQNLLFNSNNVYESNNKYIDNFQNGEISLDVYRKSKNFNEKCHNLKSISESEFISDVTKNSNLTNNSKNQSFITKSSSCSDFDI